MRPRLRSFTQVVAEKTQQCSRHQHHDYQLIFAVEGRYTCRINGARIDLQPLDLLVVKRGDWHEEFFESRVHYLALNFTVAGDEILSLGDILFVRSIAAGQQIVRGPNQEIWRIVASLERESGHRDHASVHIENALLTQVFWRVVRALPRELLSPVLIRPPTERAFRERLERVFEQHISEPLNTAQIAAKLGLSLRTLTKRCRAIVGHAPAKAFMRHRMEYASYALRQSHLSVKEVSQRMGFQNQCHFSRVFHRYVGQCPSDYRATAK